MYWRIEEPLDWQDAVDMCTKNYGAELAVINSASDLEALSSRLSLLLPQDRQEPYELWVGTSEFTASDYQKQGEQICACCYWL